MGKEEKGSNGKSRYEGGTIEKERGERDKGNSKRDNGKIKQERKTERRNKIEKSNYNGIYKEIILEGPGYLQGKKKRKDRMTIARYRCGNEMREDSIVGKKMKECAEYIEKEESITHVIRKCEEMKNEITLKEFLSGDGKGWEVMKRIDRIREEKRKEGIEKKSITSHNQRNQNYTKEVQRIEEINI